MIEDTTPYVLSTILGRITCLPRNISFDYLQYRYRSLLASAPLPLADCSHIPDGTPSCRPGAPRDRLEHGSDGRAPSGSTASRP